MSAGHLATAKLNALARTGGFWIADKTYQETDELPWHQHDRAGICVVLSGEIIESDPSGEQVYAPGDVIVRPPSCRHRNRFGPAGARMLGLEVAPEYLLAMEKRCSRLTVSAHFRTSEIVGIAARIQGELRPIDDLSSVVLEGLCLELFGRAFREIKRVVDDGPTNWLHEVRHSIARSFHKHLTLEELAAAADVHPVHLAQRHRTTFGETVGAYIRRLRIDFAVRQILETDRPMSEIAVAAGFYDQSHLSRCFKKATGLTPGTFRKERRAHIDVIKQRVMK